MGQLKIILSKFIPGLKVMPFFMLGILLLVGLFYTFIGSVDFTKLRKKIEEQRAKDLEKNEEQYIVTDKLLMQVGLNISTIQYKQIVYTICLSVFGVFTILALFNLKGMYLIIGFIISVFLYVLFEPKTEILGKFPSPFMLLIRGRVKARGKSLDADIFNSCITLKNLAIVKSEAPMSADLMFEQLMENSTKLKPIYAKMLSIYRSGANEMAFKYFQDAVGTKMGNSFSSVLSRVDKINPAELIDQVTVMQEVMSEQRLTTRIKSAEKNGGITILLATTTIFVILLDFCFVVVFMDALSMLNSAF